MKPKTDSFKSERLVMEVRKGHHADELYDLFCEKDLYTYIGRDAPPSKEWLRDGMKTSESLISSDGKEIWLGWVAKEKLSNRPVGLFEITIIDNEAYVAYTVFKPYWKMGYAVEGTNRMIDFITSNYEITRFIIEMDTRNRASVRVAEKLDFEFVKVKNNVAFVKDFVSHEFEFEKVTTN